MATSFDAVIDRALMTVEDYKLDSLLNKDPDAFQKWCDGFLIKAVPNFFRCKQTLNYNAEAREFSADLTNVEIGILADFWTLEWLSRETQVSARISGMLQVSNAFTQHSPAQLLKEKVAAYDDLRERVYQKITDYLLEDLDSIQI